MAAGRNPTGAAMASESAPQATIMMDKISSPATISRLDRFVRFMFDMFASMYFLLAPVPGAVITLKPCLSV
jgi:hypothetical protein